MGRTVVIGGHAVAHNRYRCGNRIDLLPAVGHHELHGAEVRIRVAELVCGQAHVRGAGIRARCGRCARELDVRVHVVERRVCGGNVAFHRVGVAVVIVRGGIANNGHGGGNRIDLHITIGHVEHNGLEVIVVVDEHARGQAHVRGAGIGARRCSRTRKRKVVLGIQRCVNGDGVTINRMLLAVVIRRYGIAHDGHHGGCLANSLEAIGHHKRHVEVAVRVAELVVRQVHVCCARISAGRGRLARELDVRGGVVQVAVRRGGVAFHRVGVAVVLGGVVVAHDGDLNRQRVDLHPAVGHHELHISEVRVRVAELVCGQAHVRGSGIGARGVRRACKREVSFSVQRAARGHGVTRCRMSRTVERLRVSIAHDGHNNLRSHRRDGLVTVGHHERHGAEVRVVIAELSSCQVHVRRTNFGTLGNRRTRELDIGVHVVQRACRSCDVALNRVGVAVVLGGIAVANNRYRCLNRIHLRETINHGKRHIEVAVRVRELLGRQAHVGRAGIGAGRGRIARELDVRSGIVQRACCGCDITRCRVNRTVIIGGNAIARNGYGHRQRVDLHPAIGYHELHVREVRVLVAELVFC